MGIIHWANEKVKVRTVWDIGMLKIACILIGMVLGAYLSSFVFQFMILFVSVGVLLLIILMIRIFTVK